MLLPLLAALLLAQDDLAARLRELESKVLPEPLPRMLSQDVQSRIREANRRESEAWAGIQTREDWERYKDPRIQALRESLGSPGPNPAVMTLKVTRTLEGRGHRIENLLYESRAGFRVSANL